jgi:hypothetical protein
VTSRLYLDSTLAAEASPAFDTGWNTTAAAVRRMMHESRRAGDGIASGSAVSSTAGQNALHRQYVSPCMAAGVAFTTGTTFSCQILGLESGANDNIVNRVRRVTVISRDGSTVQATLIAIANATSVVEWNTSLRNLTFLAATASGAAYTTVAGDRLTLEVGHKDSSGVSISGTLAFGSDPAGTGDLAANETDTTTTLRSWFECSLTIDWERSASGILVPQAVQRAAVW